ncbi:hypothetical protein B0H14DRAFT_2710946 [Mycena olivaceomarginata]|nr:hypothetical protein B0H14DRAFT_2710946 [Mycena olivaceomarginata]
MGVDAGNALLLIASWINLLFYMLEIVLVFKYFQRPRRPLWHKIGVATFMVADTICTVGVCWHAYLVLLVFPCVDLSETGLPPSLFWPVSLTILATYATASVEQAFLCNLFFSLTQRRFITGLFVLSIFFHLGFSWASSVLLLKAQSPGGSAFTTTQIGAISCAVTDISIAAALAFSFYRMESRTVKGRTTQTLLRRLGVLSLTSGVVVASITLLTVIALLKGLDVYILFFFCQGRAYALTILANFLLGLPGVSEPDRDPNGSTRNASTRRADAGVVFHVNYTPRSANTARPESLNLEELSDNVSDNVKALKAHPDPD